MEGLQMANKKLVNIISYLGNASQNEIPFTPTKLSIIKKDRQ